MLAMASHLSIFIGVPFVLPFIVYMAMRRESEFVANNAREALNFHCSLVIYILLCIPFIYLLIGIPVFFVIVLSGWVLAIIAAVKASDGACFHYPLAIPFFRKAIMGAIAG